MTVLTIWLKEKPQANYSPFFPLECQTVWNPEVCLHSFWNCILKPRSLGTSFLDTISHSICPACHKHFFITWNGSFCSHMVAVPLHPGYRKHIYFPLPHTCTVTWWFYFLSEVRCKNFAQESHYRESNHTFHNSFLIRHHLTEIIESSKGIWGII